MNAQSACLALVLTSVVGAQHVQWIRQGHPRPFANYARLGDINSDGIDDFAIGVSVPDGTTIGRTEVWAVSGSDGAWWPLVTPQGTDVIGGLCSHGDVDNDGHRDLILGARLGGASGWHCISGRTLQSLFVIMAPPSPWSINSSDLQGDIDVNGDGRPDVLVAYLTGTIPNGTVYAYDHTGAVIYNILANDPSPAIGYGPSVAEFIDWHHDGCDDFLVGLYDALGGGGCELISGRTGLPFFRINDPTLALNLNQGLERCGDLDGDGLPDILLGNGAPFSLTGTMQAWSSSTRQPIYIWNTGIYGDGFGRWMNGDYDVDQDGIVDILVGHPGEPLSACIGCYGSFKVFSGRTGTQMFRFVDVPLSRDGGITSVLPFPPRRGSVFPRFVAVNSGGRFPIGYPNAGLTYGRMYMFEGGPDNVELVGDGCQGTMPNEPRIGLRELSPTSSRVTVADAPPGALAFLMIGLSRLPTPIDLGVIGLEACHIVANPISTTLRICGTAGLDAGYAYRDLPHGFTGRDVQGTEVYGQWFVLAPGVSLAAGLSKALLWHF